VYHITGNGVAVAGDRDPRGRLRGSGSPDGPHDRARHPIGRPADPATVRMSMQVRAL